MPLLLKVYVWRSFLCAVHYRVDFREKSLFWYSSVLKNYLPSMSQHNSFKVGGGSSLKKRTVLKRAERVALMRKRKQWQEGRRLTGLPKTKLEA